MFERIDPRSPVPLYAQIAERLRLAIASGELPAGTGLPSVRQLAADLRVNPATVVQAYRELESEKFIVMRQGAGTFVSDVQPGRRGQEKTAIARRMIRTLLADAARAGLSLQDVRDALDAEMEAA
jgi:GntR family transcriptional regulator